MLFRVDPDFLSLKKHVATYSRKKTAKNVSRRELNKRDRSAFERLKKKRNVQLYTKHWLVSRN